MAKTSKLTGKQEKFCQLYAATGNATQSFKDAGYAWKSEGAAAKNASNLIHKNSNIQERLRELSDKAETEAIASIREMQETLTKIIREELDEEQLIVEGRGMGISTTVSMRKQAALKDRLKALELLGKMKGAFVDNVNLTGTVPVQFVDDL
jgi:phage terminase small subunit